MKEIFQEYGGVLITVVAILAVILAFSDMITTFISQARANGNFPATP